LSEVVLAGVSRAFGPVRAVVDVTLEIRRGELMAVLGPSGCGKTTLLRLIAGFERPDAGRIAVGGRELAGPACFVAPERRRIGIVFQDYALFPHLSVESNVAFGLERRPREERDRLTRRTLELVGLQHKSARHPHELSGGERQRVALARAFLKDAPILILDEPTSSVDTKTEAAIMEAMERLMRERTTFMIAHRLGTLANCDVRLQIEGGRVVNFEQRVMGAGAGGNAARSLHRSEETP
jgi:iron(III) transport system ATP-binding protein